MKPYSYTGPIDHTIPVDFSNLSNRKALITGGANGIGEAIVRKFVAEGAIVTFGDVDDERGKSIADELNAGAGNEKGGNAKFVKCDIRSWDDQVRMFEAVGGGIDTVIANAGISRKGIDSVWKLDDPSGPATKPDLNVLETNLNGTLYTFKLATHYFRKHSKNAEADKCFIITGSMVAYINSPANWEYTISKYGLLGLMCTARRSSWQQNIRINYVAPCYIRSAIRTAENEKSLIDRGVRFGETEDVAGCMARIITDRSINGRSLMIVPRAVAKEGYVDADMEDFKEDGYLQNMQDVQLDIIKDQWV